MRAAITGVGHYAPNKKLTNHDLEKMVDTNDEWIQTRTGIRERRILEDGKGTSHMAVRAARAVLEQRNISPDEIDLMIVATVTPDTMARTHRQVTPLTASVAQAAGGTQWTELTPSLMNRFVPSWTFNAGQPAAPLEYCQVRAKVPAAALVMSKTRLSNGPASTTVWSMPK